MKFGSVACTALILVAAFIHTRASADYEDLLIHFDARVGEEVLRCGQNYPGIGASNASVKLQDFRIYLSNIRLLGKDGEETVVQLTPDNLFQGDRVVLLDFENATGNCNGNSATNSVVRGKVPTGDYVGLIFDIGVPADLNHQDTTLASPPLNFSALTWPWRYGYKFTTIDLETSSESGVPLSEHAASGFSIHLGSVDCGDGSPMTAPEKPCATPNRPSYRLDDFDPVTHIVVFDLAELLANSDVTRNAPESPSGCMSGAEDEDCVPIMGRLGLSFRGQESQGQHFVRAIRAD